MSTQQLFSPTEWLTLQRVPILITKLVGKADDDNVDHKEFAALVHNLNKANSYPDSFLRELLSSVLHDMNNIAVIDKNNRRRTLVEIKDTGLPGIDDAMDWTSRGVIHNLDALVFERAADILERKVTREQAALFKFVMLKIAQDVALASGGFLFIKKESKKEKQVWLACADALRYTAESKRLLPWHSG